MIIYGLLEFWFILGLLPQLFPVVDKISYFWNKLMFDDVENLIRILLCELSVAHCTADVSVLRVDDLWVEDSVQEAHGSVLIGGKT